MVVPPVDNDPKKRGRFSGAVASLKLYKVLREKAMEKVKKCPIRHAFFQGSALDEAGAM
jgi:hypothetical protein